MNKPYISDPSAYLETIRDPMIMVVGNTYYLTGTHPPYWSGPNDGMHLWSSKDLKHFTDHGIIVKRSDIPEDMWCRDRFWAPELFTDGAKFYATFNCKNESAEHPHDFGVGLAVADHPEGPYTIVTTEAPLCDGIDGNIFQDDDGQLYIGANGILPHNGMTALYIRKLNPVAGTATEPLQVCTVGEPGEWDDAGVEGQCILKRHGIYFQWYSSWGQNTYAAGILTAPSIHGPWTKHPNNPIIKTCEYYAHSGHNHSFRGLDGKDYVIFHAISTQDSEADRKERMFIREVEYRPDGSVILG